MLTMKEVIALSQFTILAEAIRLVHRQLFARMYEMSAYGGKHAGAARVER